MFDDVKIVGMHFRGSHAKEYAAAVQPGDRLYLKRDPANEYDAYAIEVWTRPLDERDENDEPTGFHLGFVQSAGGPAPQIAYEMDMDPLAEWECEVTGVEHARNNIYPLCSIRRLQEEPA